MNNTITEEEFRKYIVYELGRIIFELQVPMNTGLIAKTLGEHLRDVVAQWPNVTVDKESLDYILALEAQ
jgi:hypothetical protein